MAACTITGGDKLQGLLSQASDVAATLQVGWFPEALYTTGVQVAYVMAIQEAGYVTEDGRKIIPPRSFMARTRDDNQEKWRAFLWDKIQMQLLEIQANGQGKLDLKKSLRALGFLVKRDIQDTLDWWAEFGEPRNAASTIKIKGFDSPLTWSGKARESLRATVK